MRILRIQKKLKIAILALTLTQVGSQHVAAKPASNFHWSNLQVASVSSDRQTLNVTRYSKNLAVLGSKALISASPGLYLKAFDYDYTYGNTSRWFVFGAYQVNPDKQRIYILDLANAKSVPKLLFSFGSEWATDVEIDPASGNVIALRATPGTGQVVEKISKSGTNRQQIWSSESSQIPLYVWSISADTGYELFLFGTGRNGGVSESVELKISSKGGQAESLIRSASAESTGGERLSIGLWNTVDVITTKSGAWACTSPAQASYVSQDRSCKAFSQVFMNDYKSVQFDSGFGSFPGRPKDSTTIVWQGKGKNYVQGVHIDPTGLPKFSSLVRIKAGSAASGRDLVVTSDTDVALDKLTRKVWKVKKW